MFKFLKKRADKLIDLGASAIDKSILTDEERHDLHIKQIELWHKTQELTASENSVRSLTRRFIALTITFLWAATLIADIAVLALLGGKMSLLDTVTAWRLPEIMALVVTFYFGMQMLRDRK